MPLPYLKYSANLCTVSGSVASMLLATRFNFYKGFDMAAFLFCASIFSGFAGAIAAANASSVDISLAVFLAGMGLLGEVIFMLMANIVMEDQTSKE